MEKNPPAPWSRLAAATPARVGLARAGDGLTTQALLDLQAAHARARDAVHQAVDFGALASSLTANFDREVLFAQSAAPDRASFIRRPDLGRRLDEDSRHRLQDAASVEPYDAILIIGDGLSSAAIEDHTAPFLRSVLPRLEGWRLAPLVLAAQARVALSDEIGHLLKADLAVMLIGERPGLSVGNSLGAYLTWGPRPGRSDSQRNCISNIHAAGLSYENAADRLVWLMTEARSRRETGVGLKEDTGRQAPPDRIAREQEGIADDGAGRETR